ncbi:MAG: hypothetical protein F6K28_33520 [Microcoleus sp. SIO2G3]|nr:hypothetical protein [Microcoleus sp. SIO2G3]
MCFIKSSKTTNWADKTPVVEIRVECGTGSCCLGSIGEGCDVGDSRIKAWKWEKRSLRVWYQMRSRTGVKPLYVSLVITYSFNF